jgi:peptide/nickel transport system substrate-binding protein
MNRHVVAAVVVAVSLLVLSAAAGRAQAPEVTPGGTLRVGIPSIRVLDPLLTNSDFDYAVLSQIFNSLVRTGRGGQPIPDLATSWNNPDENTWVFRMRRGVRWHDGNDVFTAGQSREVTAEDVKWTYQRVMDPTTRSPFASALSSIKEITVEGPYQLRITTKAPDPFLLDTIRLAGIAIVPKEAYDRPGAAGAGRAPVGSGPFRFVRFVPDDHLLVARNDAYWKRPYLDGVQFRIIPDSAAAIFSLEAGNIDLTLQTPPEEYPRLKQNARLVLYPSPLAFYRGLGFNVRRPPFDDVRVRRAIAAAIDVDAAVRNVFGEVAIRAYGQVPPTIVGHDPTLRDLWRFDQAAARRLLTEAGFAPGSDGILQKDGQRFVVEIKTLNESGRVKVITIAATNLRQVGIDARVVPQETGTWIADLNRGNTGLFMDFAFSGATGLFALFHSSNIGNSNTHFYSNPEVDKLLEEGSRTIDARRREPIWKRAQRMIMQDVIALPLYFERSHSASKRSLQGFVPQRWNLNLVSEESNVWILR